jgi:hypothetical protein
MAGTPQATRQGVRYRQTLPSGGVYEGRPADGQNLGGEQTWQ